MHGYSLIVNKCKSKYITFVDALFFSSKSSRQGEKSGQKPKDLWWHLWNQKLHIKIVTDAAGRKFKIYNNKYIQQIFYVFCIMTKADESLKSKQVRCGQSKISNIKSKEQNFLSLWKGANKEKYAIIRSAASCTSKKKQLWQTNAKS